VDDRIRQGAAHVQGSWQRARATRALTAHRRQFREFYRGLPDKKDIFYVFFSRGLLHWVTKALSYVPDNVNLVLLGSALPDYEQEWIGQTIRRPFHNIELRINDKLAWTLLFDVNEHSFGWLDIDCLVLNGDLFAEMSAIADSNSVNGVWWHDTGFGFAVAATYFQFFNARAIRALRAARLAHSPNCYSYHAVGCAPFGNRFPAEPVTRRVRRQLLRVVPPDDAGRPRVPAGESYFDTTVVPQMMARTLGFGAGRVRDLRRMAWNVASGDEFSDEIVHIGAVSWSSMLSEFHSAHRNRTIEVRYLLADNVALGTARHLPGPYAQMRELVTAELAQVGLTPAAALEAARDHLTSERGISAHAADLVLTDARERHAGQPVPE
jgi:hypothetical protein